MKKSILFSTFLLLFNVASGQTSTSPVPDVIKIDARQQMGEFVPGQILVKFRDAVPAQALRLNGLGKVGVASIDAILQKFQMKSAEKLLKTADPLTERKLLKTFTGQTFEQPSLHNIYKMELTDPSKIFDAIEQLKKDQNVEYAEPNYIFSIVEDKPVSGILTEEDVQQMYSKSAIDNRQSPPTYPPSLWRKADAPLAQTIPNDPLYPQQWYIPAVKADSAWSLTTGDTTQIIAILDTGVDWLHPDLKNKIWINQAEATGVAGVDDDGNGLNDDVRGWDYINNDNNPTDDNSHGTHVAGIAAAEANNGIGIAGVNWKAKILPIKVFQSSGRGDAATITQGIVYAASKGATVINMSFGSYSRSSTMEAALASAYATSVLVAAAGNDGLCIGPGKCFDKQIGLPFYPASLSFVLGVQAGDALGPLGFSNYDQDGPISSQFEDLLNYELRAPGLSILSTIPNGNYRSYSGTSMAAPIVSGSVTLYKSIFVGHSQELMWGNLINSTSIFLNLRSTINSNPKPILWFVNNTIIDTLDGNRNGLVNAGETIELWFTLRNTWGEADSVFVGIRFDEFEDTTIGQVLTPTAVVGSISSYAKRTNEFSPLKIRLIPTVAHNRDIVFQAMLWDGTLSDTVFQRVVVNVNNGVELSGIMDSTLVLTADKKWLVVQSFRVGLNGNLIIRPGTEIWIAPNNYISVRGHVSAIGTKDSMIKIFSTDCEGSGFIRLNQSSVLDTIRYCLFSSLHNAIAGQNSVVVENCIFENLLLGGSSMGTTLGNCGVSDISILKNSVIRYNENKEGEPFVLRNTTEVSFNVFYLNNFDHGEGTIPTIMNYNNFVRNSSDGAITGNVDVAGIYLLNSNSTSQVGNNFVSNRNIVSVRGYQDIIEFKNQYWGSILTANYQNSIYDFWDNPLCSQLNIVPFLSKPSDSAHGIVWKVLVDGIDPQDEHLDPIGIGVHRFDAYFNRAMDTSYTPQLSFGVRKPYIQQSVSESASWSQDRKVWTAYKTVKLYTGDGINRIRVTGARDPEGFEIPIEDMRFEFLIDAAGTSSTEFTANPGLGKIKLEWNNAGVTDLLGFNMYRFKHLTDTTFTEPQLINTQLITDTLYTDFNVTPGTRYYYKYKVVRTDFSESDYSRVTNAIALTAAPGDANGDLSTNVLDIISIVSKILNQNPQPFIFEAADINHDNVINVLDIVGTINIILRGGGSGQASLAGITSGEQAIIRLERRQISLESPVPVGGVQLTLTGIESEEVLTRLKAIESFEFVTGRAGKDTLIVVMYSLSGNVIALGNQPLLKIDDKDAKIISAVVATSLGESMKVKVYNNGESLIPENYVLQQNYPNPFNLSTRLQFGIPEKTKVKIIIYNILGQRVKTFELGEQAPGRYEVMWDGTNEKGSVISSGVYFYRFESERFIQTKKLLLIK